MANRLVLTIRRSLPGVGRAVGDPAEDLLLLLRPGPEPRLLAVVDGVPLDLVEHVVDRGLVADARRTGVEHLPVDDSG